LPIRSATRRFCRLVSMRPRRAATPNSRRSSMVEGFASVKDTAEQKPQVVELAKDIYGFCSTSDPNCGFIVGDDSVIAIDARATPALAREMIAAIREITEKPIKFLFLTHY